MPRRQSSPDGFVSVPGIGRHEVIVESPDHNADLARLPVPHVRSVLEAYVARYRALRAHTRGVVVIFRNHGARAGTSLSHPHSQIIATPVVPVQIRHRFDVAVRHYDTTGSSLYLDNLAAELSDGRRIVHESRRFVAFQPYASLGPHETWIVPRMQTASFGGVTPAALDELAGVLRLVLAALSTALDDPDYNLIVHSAPPGDEKRGYFVWHIRIMPRLATPAGFELATGMAINASLPEQTAGVLRAAVQAESGRQPVRGGRAIPPRVARATTPTAIQYATPRPST
jgi:UDPglucose--hexose-1-phosphate uridylyltransferase